MKRKALISVSDKTGILEFSQALIGLNWEIISTGGTAKLLADNGIPVTPVSKLTGFPEIMNGRVKTLHPKIHGAILCDRDIPEHLNQALEQGIELIDLVVVNLYPFANTMEKPNVKHTEIIENIDIGGPSMVRSTAKNYKHTCILTDPSDFSTVIDQLRTTGHTTSELRQYLAGKAFAHTAAYDTMIANYFSKLQNEVPAKQLLIATPLQDTPRYGENPHQQAGWYQSPSDLYVQLHGKQLSYNNYLDMDAAIKVVHKFDEPAVAIVKHTNPCGVGVGNNLIDAYEKAFATDTLSPYGGIVAVNRVVDLTTAEKINEVFTEIIIAPSFTDAALEKLMKKKDRRLLTYKPELLKTWKGKWSIVSCLDGYLTQQVDIDWDKESEWQVVSKRKPTMDELLALRFGWKIVSTLKSNAVAFTGSDRTLGLGIGQTSRIDSTLIAVTKALKFGLSLEGSICASDGYFPFKDSVEEVKKLGVTAIIQPGGSKGDAEVIKACDDADIAMIFTGMRHFRH